MNGHARHWSRRRLLRWFLPTALVALIACPIILYHILPLAGLPAALASGVIVVVAVKHLGLVAVLLTPFYALLRRR